MKSQDAPASGMATGSPGARPAITLEAIGKRFADGTPALAEVDLTVGRGEFVCLLGPSGCGKSTLLRIIAGLESASSGRASTADATGAPLTGPAGSAIGFVFQEPALMPWANVADNVALPLRLRHIPARERAERTAEVLELVGLTGFARHLPRQLSGGMKMRTSLARALVMRPELLLLDEPFAALDEITRTRLNDDLARLHTGRDLTVVFVTHSVPESVYLADRILVMSPRPGRVAREVCPARLRGARPRDTAWRTSNEHTTLSHEISACLAELIAAAPADQVHTNESAHE